MTNDQTVTQALDFIDKFFEPWGSWKTVWWEGEVSDNAAFSADNALKHVANILRRTAHSGEGRESVSAPTQRMEKALGAKFVATGEVERLRAAMKQAEIHIDCASFRKAQDILLAALAQPEGAKSD